MRKTVERPGHEATHDAIAVRVSHELRTPLTPLKALTQLLRARVRRAREGRPLDLDSLDANLQVIERQVDRMERLVSDVADVARATLGPLEVQRGAFDLVDALRAVVRSMESSQALDPRHVFVVDAPEQLTVPGDHVRVEQAIANLIANAMKFTPDGGEIAIAIRPHGDEVDVVISDDGIGISRSDIDHVGDAFTRGQGRASTYAGMGLGLYLARLIAERHGGRVELSSNGEGRGTTAQFTLPL